MTPPAPKTAKRAAPKGAKAKSTKPRSTGTKKSPARKKKSRKKKGGSGNGLLIAFMAGIILASAAFWFTRDMSLRDLFPPQEQQTQATAAKSGKKDAAPTAASGKSKPAAAGKPDAKSKPPATGKPDAKGKPADKAQASGKAKSRPGSGPVVSGSVSPPPAEKKTPPPAADTKAAEEQQRLKDRQSAIDSALDDLRHLPFEEAVVVPLDERIRQADYALMQAAWAGKLKASALRLASVEDRLDGIEPYQFQTIDVLPGKKTGPFIKELRSCLNTWAEGATLAETGNSTWKLSVNGVHTHTLRLYPGKAEFPPLQQKKTPPPPPDTPQTGIQTAMSGSTSRRGASDPRLVIVMDDLGAGSAPVNKLLALNYPVTFAFWPHGAHTKAGARAAHAKGREILVHLPMEPVGYPKVKPGPNVLLTGMTTAQIRRTVTEAIRAVPYAAGLNNHMGSRFTQHAPGIATVVQVLREQRLFALDSLTHNRSVFSREAKQAGIKSYTRHVFLDVTASRAKILAELRKAEQIALLTGQAVAIGHPLPETLSALKEWERLRDKRVRIVRLQDLP